MTIPDQVRLKRCLTGQEDVARVSTLSREDAKVLVDAAWWSDLEPLIRDVADEPDRHWNWRQLVSVYQNKPYFRAVCVKTADGAVQAAMLFRVNALSAIEAGRGVVFVDRLATAPRNRDKLVKNPMFRGAGGGLLTYAAAVSYSLGFSGRLNLFPIANEQFYLDRGFVRTGVTQDGETLFELPAAVALSLLQSRGLLDA